MSMSHRFETIHACVSDAERERRVVDAFIGRTGRRVVHLNEPALAASLDVVEVLVCLSPPRIDWSRARCLRLLQFMGSGIERLFPIQGLPPGVEIANARGMHLPEMRDHALALMLAFERALPTFLDRQREREWTAFAAGTLCGKTVGIVGLGEVGRSLAHACAALGMRVVGTRKDPQPTPHVDEVHGPGSLDRLLSTSDYVVVTVPLTPSTRGLLGAAAFARMKSNAVLVQLSRGGVVDERALADALREGRLRGAALDVFEEEPLSGASPLWSTPNLVITPHVAGFVADYFERALAVFLENVESVERGQSPRTRVDRDRGY